LLLFDPFDPFEDDLRFLLRFLPVMLAAMGDPMTK
jgi:hypothetical protein